MKESNAIQPEPDARHYLTHDVFTYLTSLADPEKVKEDTATFQSTNLKPGDSLFYSRGFMMLEKVETRDSVPKDIFGEDGKVHEATIKVYAKTGSIYTITPKLAFAHGGFLAVPDTLMPESMALQLQRVNPDNSIQLGVKESGNILEYVTLKAYKYPMIKLLWIGVVITAIGILMSMIHRIRLNRISSNKLNTF